MLAISWGNSPALFSRRALVNTNSTRTTGSCGEINTDFKPGVHNVGKSLRFAGSGKVTILSWNVKGQYMGINPDGSINKETRAFKARLRMLERIIEEYNPEILGFQECPHNLLRAFQEELGTQYPHIFYGTPGSIPMRLQVGMLVRQDVGVVDVTSPRLRQNGRGILRGIFELEPEQSVSVDVAHYLSLLGNREEADLVKRANAVKAKKLEEAEAHAALLRRDMEQEDEEADAVSPRYVVMDGNIQDDPLGDQVVGVIERRTGLQEAKQGRTTYHHASNQYADARFDRAFGPEGTTVEVVGDFNDPVVRAAGVDHLPIICIGPAYAIQRETPRLAVAFGSARRMDFVA